MEAGDDDEIDYEIARLVRSSAEQTWNLEQKKSPFISQVLLLSVME